MKNTHYQNTVSLFIAQLFGMMATIICVFVGSLSGIHLAPTKVLTTLPVATLVIGAALAAYPSASFMNWVGRKRGNMLACSLALIGAIVCVVALYFSAFYWFSFGMLLVGINNAFIQQYRFAVIETLPVKMHSFGVSVLLFANAFSAFFGTEIATRAKFITNEIYMGSMMGACLVLLLALIGLMLYRTALENSYPQNQPQTHLAHDKPITANLIPAITVACLSYFMMAWRMVAMPISMHKVHAFSVAQAGFVMQSHLMAMYLPSLVTGLIAKKIGNISVIFIGFVFLLFSLIVNLTGITLMHYWLGLVLLGIGWNFTFICGTTIFTKS